MLTNTDTFSPPIAQIANVSFSYGTGRLALDSADLCLPVGGMHGVLGPNGSGKSTLFKLMLGFIAPSSGFVSVLGKPAGKGVSNSQIGFMAAHLPTSILLTVDEFVGLHETLQSSFDRALARRLLDHLEVPNSRRQLITELSHGNKRKVQLICALAHRPRLLVLDEPFSGLDPAAHYLVASTLRYVVEGGGTIVFASHETVTVGELADSVTVMAEGRVCAHGSPSDLCRRFGVSDLRAAYLVASGTAPDLEGRALAIRGDLCRRPILVNAKGAST